jgi:hypothetical protein
MNDRTYRIDDVVRGITAVVVPLEGDLVTALDLDSLGRSDVVHVAGHGSRSDVLEGVVVGRRADVSSSAITNTLVDVVDEDGVDSGVGSRETGTSRESEESVGSHIEVWILDFGFGFEEREVV